MSRRPNHGSDRHPPTDSEGVTKHTARSIARQRLRRLTHARWNALAEWPLTATALVFLAVYAWFVLGDLSGSQAAVAEALMLMVWAVFAIDYVAQLSLAEAKGRWFITHLPLLAMVALPVLRPLRLLRLVTLWTTLQRTAGTALRSRISTYVVGSSVVLIFIAALAVLEAERHAAGSTITSFPGALWWAATTVTTVGYGDLAPVTAEGRLIAVGLMIAGIALVGAVTAILATWLVEQVSADEEAAAHPLEASVKALTAELTELRAQLSTPPVTTKE